MGDVTCAGCRELAELVLQLQAQLRDLQAKLGLNASNSSLPPSANPLGAPKPVKKKKSKRKRGGQPGHPPHLRQLLPLDQVTLFEMHVPVSCRCCNQPLDAGDNDPAPVRFQTVELPPVLARVVEHQGHTRVCGGCGTVNHEPIPEHVRAHVFGPRLTAALAYLAGCHGMSKRGVEELADKLLGVPVSLGSVCNLEREVSEAIAPAHAEAVKAIQRADVKHADETGWKKKGRPCWLWTAATLQVVAFSVHAKRSARALAAFLGETITGILHSDRWGVYGQVPPARRQLCWAHLKRDFQKLIDRGGPGEATGRAGRRIVKIMFAAWHQFREGKLTRPQLQAAMDPIERRLNGVLVEGALGSDARVRRFCENLMKLEPGLWTFVTHDNVEPTNNFMERLLRRAVLWRKRSFGCDSEAGCRFVERVLTVVQTSRLQGRSSLDYLQSAVAARRAGKACPSLLGGG